MRSSERRMERERAEATLATVDAARASGRATGDDERERELGRLALALRDGAPETSAEFGGELEARVLAGFARDGVEQPARGPARRGTAKRVLPGRPALRRPALGALAAVLLVVVGSATLLAGLGQVDRGEPRGGITGEPGGGIEGETMQAPERDAASPRTDAPAGREIAPSAPPTTVPVEPGFAPERSERSVARTASLTLAAPERRIDEVADGIVAVTQRHRGFVVSSSTFSGADQTAGGSFDLRVPSEELRPVLSELVALGTVRAQSQTGDDVTEAVVSVEDRLDAARAERRALLGRLSRADTDREARALRRQLELVSAEVNGLRGQLRSLEERSEYARVSVVLEDAAEAGGGQRSSTERALDDAVGSIVAAFNFLVRALGVLVPLAVVAAVAWFAFATVRRRRREAALD